jgi:hypothetical protein
MKNKAPYKPVQHRELIIAVVVAALYAPTVYADCGKNKILFSCPTIKGKKIEVCDSGKTIDYSFGKAQKKPEIAIKIPREKASTFQWAGIGRYESYAIDIPNGKATYNVFWGVDRLSDEHAVEAGVNVLIDQKLMTTVNCSGENIVNNIQGVNLKATE